MTRTAGAQIGCQRPSRFWGLGCPKIYHEAEDTLAKAHQGRCRWYVLTSAPPWVTPVWWPHCRESLASVRAEARAIVFRWNCRRGAAHSHHNWVCNITVRQVTDCWGWGGP
ncbi:hypothetical protein [Thiolapillus sp.]|uniref:hypothetical protein n=1 Tax=Thiolapillus sp. TaxID=2017437 RepID=UPI0025E363D8|nr:hypothetical protein [Thiolapillus sp.]